jgi:eukaryotic-like serine/threonine-protein kinase
MPPRTFGPYRLLSVLGGAGIGRVHLGRTDKGVRVAVRVIRPEFAADPWFRACLRDEVEVVTRVRGPRVAALLDADAEADVPWLATEYVPAPSLATVLSRSGPLSVDGVRRLGVELVEALEAIHDAGAVHRNLKPGNVLITADGPRVVDVGITRAAAASPLTRGGGLVGTPGYLAPEQLLNGPGEPASDVFALGSVLLHAATWREPFGTGDVTTVLHRVLRVGPDLRGLDPGLVPVVASCLHPDPSRRPSPREVRDLLLAPATAPPDVDPDDRAAGPDPEAAVPAPRTPADDEVAPAADAPVAEDALPR